MSVWIGMDAQGLTQVEAGGPSSVRIFGLAPAVLTDRQMQRLPRGTVPQDRGPLVLVRRADAVVTEATLVWLAGNPGNVLVNDLGAPVIGVVPRDRAEGVVAAMVAGDTGSLGDLTILGRDGEASVFSEKLRRRQPLAVLDLTRITVREAERVLFKQVYKGVTDLVTGYVWPWPAFWATRILASLGVTPNPVTVVGIVFTIIAAWQFAEGAWVAGFAAAWAMTFLDTVDGKLARVTGTSSRIGDLLDHGNDWLHPPAWWICFAVGLSPGADFIAPGLDIACGVILATYVLGRISETAFRKRFGFNQYIWQPFDSRLRVIIARRNIILLMLMVGVALGQGVAGYYAVAAWSIGSIGLQTGRWLMAESARRRGAVVRPWLT